jgi:NADPH:quinone reductase
MLELWSRFIRRGFKRIVRFVGRCIDVGPQTIHPFIKESSIMKLSRVVLFDRTGGPDVLRLAEEPVREPGPGEVRVRVRAIGLNRAEVMYRSGEYALQPKAPSRIGVEAAGTVEALGAGVTGLAVGQRVSILQTIDPQVHGVYADRTVVPATSVIASPDELSDEQAASLWHVFSMAYGQLVAKAQVGPADVVLITAASSAVGIASIQVAKAEGATVIATTRRSNKAPALLEAGADHVIATEEEDLAARVMQLTGGRGATVILDSVLGETLAKLADAAAPGARIFLGGLLQSNRIELPVWPVLLKGLTITGFVGFLAVQADPSALAAYQEYMRRHIAAGRFRPLIDRVFALNDIVQAHRHMEGGSQIGKIVVVP